jgi:hypothetical protein
MMTIGKLRRTLFMPFDCKWNAWVRDFTAWLEGKGMIEPFASIISGIAAVAFIAAVIFIVVLAKKWGWS